MNEKTSASHATETDDGYPLLEKLVAARAVGHKGPLFTTDADPDQLWAAYLDNIPGGKRQHYNCHCCRRFIQRYGGLVEIVEGGISNSIFWSRGGHPEFFAYSAAAMLDIVNRAKVTGIFFSSDEGWGTPRTGDWTHLSCPNPDVYKGKTKTAAHVMAEKSEEYGMLCRGLAEYPKEAVVQAVRVLESDAVCRSEKALAPAKWLLDLHGRVEGAKGPRRNNTVWAAAATAPPGFCHVKATVISTLLDDIVAGLGMDVIKRRWAEKLHPFQYQRPTAPPSDGTIKQATELVKTLGLERSFARRFAVQSDVLKKEWMPLVPEAPQPQGGIFDHLKSKKGAVPKVALPRTKITWERFARTVLPVARGLEVLIPSRGAFYGLVAAADPESPPLLQWDGLEGHPRNPASYYFYHGGSHASGWGMSPGMWVPATMVFLPPHQWQAPNKFKHQGRGVFFALAGCWDRNGSNCGLGLFPETIRNELHGVRSVIEAHSRVGKIPSPESGTANGLAWQEGCPVVVRVAGAGGTAEYEIDRWE